METNSDSMGLYKVLPGDDEISVAAFLVGSFCKLCFNFSHTYCLFHTDNNSFYSVLPINKTSLPHFPPQNQLHSVYFWSNLYFPRDLAKLFCLIDEEASVMKVSASVIQLIVISKSIF